MSILRFIVLDFAAFCLKIPPDTYLSYLKFSAAPAAVHRYTHVLRSWGFFLDTNAILRFLFRVHSCLAYGQIHWYKENEDG